MTFTIANYIQNNGSPESYASLSYSEAKAISSEYWDTSSGSIVTIIINGFELEISYDQYQKKAGESLVRYTLSSEILSELLRYEMLFESAFLSEDELVIFLKNKINIHLQIDESTKDFIKLKVVAQVTEGARNLIRRLFNKITLAETKSLLNKHA